MTICSLDTSTNKSGCATFVNGELVDYTLLDFSKIKDVDERIDKMGKAILEYLELHKPDDSYIEHPQGHGSNVSMVGKLCEILGIVRSYHIKTGCGYFEYAPSEWRKYAGIEQGKKNRQELKQASIDYVKEKYGIEVNDDVADAISLGTAVINYFNLLDKQKEV